jgi:flagellar hook-associated protein 3 FlgL
MDRISTASSYSAILASLNSAQAAQNAAIAEVSTGMKATDLKGFGATAETLTAMQTVQAKVTAYLGQTQIVSDKLSSQDTAFTALASAAQGSSKAITDAIGSGNASALMQTLDGYFQDAVGALNTQFNGEYLFSGGAVNTPPVSAANLSSLTPPATVASVFQNGQLTPTSQIDSSTNLKTGFLADQVGSPLFTALQSIQNSQATNGPFSATLTATQTTFLQGVVASLNSANTGIVNLQGQNGLMQNQVTGAQTDLTSQQTTLQTMIGGTTNADLAQAAANLQQAQLAIQASAQVFQSLKSESLASLLPIA